MIPAALAKVLAIAGVPQPENTRYMLIARGAPDLQQKALIYVISISSITLFAILMMVSIHRSVMAAREDRLAGIDQHRSGNVFVKLAKWVWSGIVLLFWAFFALFTRKFWKQSWADLKVFLSPYSWPGVWVNAYTCGRYCNADPDHDPELAGIVGLRKEASGVVAQEPKPNATVVVSETLAPQRPALAIIVEEV
ncbi:hypothetical protein VSDG_05127 [Cytospora chrysosperma]|uniref:Uncharacterized protein n=1 Tax=Cytospora chrysosperma TaxID=252740 RepID=A0A423VXZ9_CYTCH|nr:hypothetical protein VSDG_05127 [Valsa sordida]